MKNLIALLFILSFLISCGNEGGDLPSIGTNGSYTGMVIVEDFMYRVDDENLTTFDVSDPEAIQHVDRQTVGFLIESIFHMEGILFIGSGEALHIFEINDKGIPERKSQTNYSNFSLEQTPCDPVISDGNHAFVTLSTTETPNEQCTRFVNVNELRIYDITDLTDPIEVNLIEMINPKGLSYDDNLLFVCENIGGLKVFDKSDVLDLQLIYHFDNINAYDVIAKDGLLIVIGKGAIYQYDYNSILDMKLISTLNL